MLPYTHFPTAVPTWAMNTTWYLCTTADLALLLGQTKPFYLEECSSKGYFRS